MDRDGWQKILLDLFLCKWASGAYLGLASRDSPFFLCGWI